MKKTLIIIIIFILTASYSYSQKNKFEKKLNLFLFSLNVPFENISDEDIINMNFDNKDTISQLCEKFISENKKEIIKYKENIFKEYENNQDILFDFENYTKVDLTEIKKQLNELDLTSKKPLFYLANPLALALSYKMQYIVNMNTKNINRSIIKSTLGFRLLKTRKINNNQWEIIENSYDLICKFIYDLEQANIIKFEVFKRN